MVPKPILPPNPNVRMCRAGSYSGKLHSAPTLFFLHSIFPGLIKFVRAIGSGSLDFAVPFALWPTYPIHRITQRARRRGVRAESAAKSSSFRI